MGRKSSAKHKPRPRRLPLARRSVARVRSSPRSRRWSSPSAFLRICGRLDRKPKGSGGGAAICRRASACARQPEAAPAGESAAAPVPRLSDRRDRPSGARRLYVSPPNIPKSSATCRASAAASAADIAATRTASSGARRQRRRGRVGRSRHGVRRLPRRRRSLAQMYASGESVTDIRAAVEKEWAP